MNFSNCYKESNEIHGMIWLKMDHFAVNNNNLSLNLTKWFPLWILWHGSHGESYHIFTIKQFHHVGAGGVMGALQGRQVPPPPPLWKMTSFFSCQFWKPVPHFSGPLLNIALTRLSGIPLCLCHMIPTRNL